MKNITLYDAIIEGLHALGGDRHFSEINNWITEKYGSRWKSCATEMADMVHPDKGGKNNTSSRHPIKKRILTRRGDGIYSL